jgi:hypothetical protein
MNLDDHLDKAAQEHFLKALPKISAACLFWKGLSYACQLAIGVYLFWLSFHHPSFPGVLRLLAIYLIID